MKLFRLASSNTRGGVFTFAFLGFLASLPCGFFMAESYVAHNAM
ncbi:MAG TPA: hypothetical protein VNT80_06845 [Acidimicrobiales bacterium]|nr:hypothetical protein [Acidimicrobiales bacterium]